MSSFIPSTKTELADDVFAELDEVGGLHLSARCKGGRVESLAHLEPETVADLMEFLKAERVGEQ